MGFAGAGREDVARGRVSPDDLHRPLRGAIGNGRGPAGMERLTVVSRGLEEADQRMVDSDIVGNYP